MSSLNNPLTSMKVKGRFTLFDSENKEWDLEVDTKGVLITDLFGGTAPSGLMGQPMGLLLAVTYPS